MSHEQSLADAVRDLVLATERFRARRSRHHGLAPTTLSALAHLHLARSVTAGELARHLDIGAAAATEVIDKLEHLGMVRRTRHDRDRRKLLVELTDREREIIGQVYGEFATRIDQAAAMFDSTSRAVVWEFATTARDQLSRPSTR